MKDKIFRFLRNAILICSIFGIWKIVSIKANPLFVPDPILVIKDLVHTFKSGTLIVAIGYSFLRITVATLLSAILAIPIGVLVHNYRVFDYILNPIISAMRYLPVTAFYPLLIMWFGIDETMKIVFLFIATFVYMMPSVVLSLGDVRDDLVETGVTLGMSKLQTIFKIQIPASLPSIMNSFVMMYGIGFTYISVAETINAKYGLGYIIQQSSSRGKTDLVFMAIIVIICISIIFDVIAKQIIRKIFRWRYLGGDAE